MCYDIDTFYNTQLKCDMIHDIFVDTFLVRLGDFSGSGFILISKSFGVAFSQVPLLAIPFAGCVALLGFKIPPKEKIAS